MHVSIFGTTIEIVETLIAEQPAVIPWHRVMATDGGLRGYSGDDGVATKRRRLDFEGGAVQTRLSTER